MPSLPSASRWLVSTDWLASRLDAPDLVVVDGSYYLPAMKRDAAAEYLAGHIPGAVRFDIDAIADHANPLPHMLPNAQQFAREVGALGIADTDTIVVYDGAGLFSAPRVWWTFRLFGAEKVFILDGGLPQWKREGRPLQQGAVTRPLASSRSRVPPSSWPRLTRSRPPSRAAAHRWSMCGRPTASADEAPEPRPGLRSGHMPGALNVPSTVVVENGRLAAKAKIEEAFAAAASISIADHHQLRLRRDGGDTLARARCDRQSAEGAL